jgi:hypothetical protein
MCGKENWWEKKLFKKKKAHSDGSNRRKQH